jgi:hypothetical protein
MLYIHHHMISLERYTYIFDTVLIALLIYSVILIYNVKADLYALVLARSHSIDFYLGLILIGCVTGFYRYYSNQLDNYNTSALSAEDKARFATLQTNLGHLKFAIISGFAAIIIGSLALINKVVPSFFITLVMIYYADQNI